MGAPNAMKPVKAKRVTAPLEPLVAHQFPKPNVRRRAFDLLSAQPLTLEGLSPEQRSSVIVTAIADPHGVEHVLSRFGDRVWNLTPEIETKNLRASQTSIVWPEGVPELLVLDAKAALYRALRQGRNRARPWSGSAVLRVGVDSVRTLRYIADLGISSFSQLRALHVSDYIATLRQRLSQSSVRAMLEIIDLVWAFPADLLSPLPENPWAKRTFSEAYGASGDGQLASRTGKTPVIPRSIQRTLFEYCEQRLSQADAILRARDARAISARSSQLTAIRDAVLYVVQITSGMRHSEAVGITSGCWRSEVRNGVTFHWVRTREIKTGKGVVDFLVPQKTLEALELLQRYAAPFQRRLADEAKWLEDCLRLDAYEGAVLRNEMSTIEMIHRLSHVKEISSHLFLSVNKTARDHLGSGNVGILSLKTSSSQLKALAKSAGTNWALASHQCRRTFAYNVANSRLGRMGLAFIKWQFKHSSMSWTQLYASNPYQDHNLYREFDEEMLEARVELLEGWSQADQPLSGGAGKRLMQTRAIPARNLDELLRSTAASVDLRSTGHAWCLSGAAGCHGQGIYEPTMCGGCSQAVIDGDQASAWQMIHVDNLRLAAIADCGSAVNQKARRAIARSAQVLEDLGVSVPQNATSFTHSTGGSVE